MKRSSTATLNHDTVLIIQGSMERHTILASLREAPKVTKCHNLLFQGGVIFDYQVCKAILNLITCDDRIWESISIVDCANDPELDSFIAVLLAQVNKIKSFSLQYSNSMSTIIDIKPITMFGISSNVKYNATLQTLRMRTIWNTKNTILLPETLNVNTTLKELDFSHCRFDEMEDSAASTSAATLFCGLQRNRTLKCLRFCDNDLSDVQVQMLVSKISNQVQELYLNTNNTIGDLGYTALAKLLDQTQALKVLQLSNTTSKLTSSAPFDQFCQSLSNNRTLQTLDLSKTQPPNINALCQALVHNTTLRHLNLAHNNKTPTTTTIMDVIPQYLSNWKGLQTLDLSNNKSSNNKSSGKNNNSNNTIVNNNNNKSCSTMDRLVRAMHTNMELTQIMLSQQHQEQSPLLELYCACNLAGRRLFNHDTSATRSLYSLVLARIVMLFSETTMFHSPICQADVLYFFLRNGPILYEQG